jgi:cell division transport system permease protein
MQLVGAKTGFIITPFLKRAFFHGLMSGIIASGLLYALVNYLLNTLSELRQLHNEKELVFLFAGIICTGVIIGIGSTWVTVKKYLHMSLDELY